MAGLEQNVLVEMKFSDRLIKRKVVDVTHKNILSKVKATIGELLIQHNTMEGCTITIYIGPVEKELTERDERLD